jgi:hypothetical protein
VASANENPDDAGDRREVLIREAIAALETAVDRVRLALKS